MKERDPRVAVFCSCGAQWFGRHAIDNPVIADHAERCGPPILRSEFEHLGFTVKFPKGWTRAERKAIY